MHTKQIEDRYVWCDRKNLNRVLLNLLSNAYKFTPAGGSISASIWQSGTTDNGYGTYEIRVQDSGIGMSKEFAERMFNAFERERTSTVSGIEGTGLGLSITKSLVDLMGGTIEVMTANAFKEDVDAAAEAGMQAHVAKPVDVGVLMRTLTSVLR